MKFKALAASFLAAASLGACNQMPAAQAAATDTSPAPAVYDVKCIDSHGRTLAEGQSAEGLTNWGGGQTRIVFTDGREHQQAGGICTASKPGR
jgi:hypothetical protein